MLHHAPCLCGPRRLRPVTQVADAVARHDPTGTGKVRAAFARDLDGRWRRLRLMTAEALRSRFMSATSNVNHAALTGQDPVVAFQSWFDEALRQVVIGHNGMWTARYVRSGAVIGGNRAAKLVVPRSAPRDRVPVLQALCVVELQGVAEAVSQQVVRAFGSGLMLNQSASKVAQSVGSVIDKIGVQRGRLLAEFMVVRAHAAATLDAFRAAGVPSVGTVAERVRSRTSPATDGLTRDAKPKSFKGVMRAEKKLQEKFGETGVDVLTAGDDLVCDVCQDISDNGPYTLDHAESLIPAHPKCRCAFVPADLEDAPLLLDYNPDEPRDGHGMWSGIGGAQMKTWSPPQHDWNSVEGQDHTIDEPPLPDLKQKPYSYSYVDKATGEKKIATVHPPDKRLSSGVVMREPDGRVWLVKPTNGFGGYKWTFPKGGVDEGLHPQANAIKETFEETGLKARITGYAGDYHGDTSITRMYHAERVGGHPKDKGWETEQVALAHPDDLKHMLNRSRDRKIAAHHVLTRDEFNPDEPRDPHGKWTTGGALGGHLTEGEKKFSSELNFLKVEHHVNNEGEVPSGNMFEVKKEDVELAKSAAGVAGVKLTHLGSLNEEDSHHGFVVEPRVESKPGSIDMKDLVKVSGKMGSNEGGVYEGPDHADPYNSTKQYYIKQPATPDHVTNELLTARLYQLAGANTLKYVPVEGGAHVATELEDLFKKNVSQLTANERTVAKQDFAIHAWLANWDAAGTGGDNVGVRINKDGSSSVVTLDTGGGLKYRAQGTPKGDAFGDKVTEINTLRDASKNPDAAALFGDMTHEQLVSSIKRVTEIPNGAIVQAVKNGGGSLALAEQLIARKNDLAAQAIDLSQDMPAPPKTTSKTVLGPNTSVAPAAPTPTFKTKMEHAKHLLMKGTTSEELKKALNWPSIGVPKTAADLGLKLTKTKVNGVFHYKGEPIDGSAAPLPSAPAAVVKVAPAPSSKYDINKPHENFAQGIFAATGKHPSIGVFGPASPYHGKDYVAVGSIDPGVVATVAKYHPQMKAIPESTNIFTLVSNIRPASAFDPEPTAHDITTPLGNFKKSLEEQGVKYSSQESHTGHFITLSSPKDVSKAIEVAKWHPSVEKLSAHEYFIAKPGQVSPLTAAPTATAAVKFPPPTDAELAKAKKNVELQMQYVPGASGLENHPEAKKLLAAFNAKYAGKTLAEHELPGKVADFKKLQADMIPLMGEQQKIAALQAAKTKAEEAAAQQKLLAAAEAKKAAEKAAFEAKLNDPKVKAQYDALHSIGVTNAKDLEKNNATYISALAKTGHHINGADAAYIVAYRGSSYDALNESLWRGDKMNLKQSIYAAALEKAFDKLPSYEGYAQRGVNTSGAFERYAENVGHVVTEKGFSSYGAKQKLWGETTIHLQAKDLKDMRVFNPGEGGGELILQRGSMIHITKVDPKTKEVWAEQIG